MAHRATLIAGTMLLFCSSCTMELRHDDGVEHSQVQVDRSHRTLDEAWYGPMSRDSSLKSRDAVVAMYSNADWLEFKYGDNQFLFCANALPSFGNARINVHGWVYRNHSSQWEKVITAWLSTRVSLSVDRESGLLSATGSANDAFASKSVLTINLNGM